MKLTIPKMNKANICYVFLKQQSNEYLDEQGISQCEECKGIGLENINKFDGSYSWNGTSYCEYCNGIGFKGVQEKGLQIDLLHYICRNCGGLGCTSCNKGIVDWIDHSMGR